MLGRMFVTVTDSNQVWLYLRPMCGYTSGFLSTELWIVEKTVNTATMAFDRARSDKVMATIVAAEEIAEEVLADRQQIVDLDRKRNQTREAIR